MVSSHCMIYLCIFMHSRELPLYFLLNFLYVFIAQHCYCCSCEYTLINVWQNKIRQPDTHRYTPTSPLLTHHNNKHRMNALQPHIHHQSLICQWVCRWICSRCEVDGSWTNEKETCVAAWWKEKRTYTRTEESLIERLSHIHIPIFPPPR